MKTKGYDDEKTIPQLLENIYENIIPLYRQKEKLFDYLWVEDKIIQIKADINRFTFGFFYYLYNLITNESNKEIINFCYDFNFIKEANKFLVKKPKNIIRQIIGIKIVDELINNFTKSIEEDEYLILQPKIEKIILKLQIAYENVFTRHMEIVEEYNLPKDLEDLDIEKIYSKIIIDIFRKPNFENFENIYYLLFTFEIDSTYIEENIISEIKNLINSDEYENKFLLKKEDFDLEKNNTNGKNYLTKKINLLYSLLCHILNDSSDIKDFPFLSKTSMLLDEIFLEYNKEKLLSKIDKGLKYRFLKVIEILDDNKTLLSYSVKTQTSSKVKEKKRKNKTQIKNNPKKVPEEKVLSKYFDITIHNKEFLYEIEAFKIYDSFNSSSFAENNLYKEFDNKYFKIHEINRIPEKEKKNKKYNYIFNLLNNLKYIPEEFIQNVNYKAIINKEKNIIKILIRCENMVYLFSLDLLDSILNKIEKIPQFIIIK